MKKLLIILGILMFSILSSSCEKEIKFTMEELTNEIKKDIKESYLERYKIDGTYEDIWMMKYYGKYDKSYAVVLNETYIDEDDDIYVVEEVAGFSIVYNFEGAYIHVYNNGNLYRLQEAYDKGLIDEDSLFKLRAIYKHTTEFYDDFKNYIEENKYGKK